MKITNTHLPFAAKAIIHTNDPDTMKQSLTPYFRVLGVKKEESYIITHPNCVKYIVPDAPMAKTLFDYAEAGFFKESKENISDQIFSNKSVIEVTAKNLSEPKDNNIYKKGMNRMKTLFSRNDEDESKPKKIPADLKDKIKDINDFK